MTVDGNASIQVNEPVYFAVNSALANNLEKDDDVKVILLGTTRENDSVKKNMNLFMEELHHFLVVFYIVFIYIFNFSIFFFNF